MADQARDRKAALLVDSAALLDCAVTSLSADLATQALPEEAADALAQAIVCAAPIIAAAPNDLGAALQWLSKQLSAWERFAIEEAAVLSTEYSVPSPSDSPAHLYEHFLHHYARHSRKR